jgi:hypothetical protein
LISYVGSTIKETADGSEIFIVNLNFIVNTRGRGEMSKIFILSCLCLVILFINYVDGQNRPNRPVKPARRPYKTPPARVLNKVEPKGRARQLLVRQRQTLKKPLTHGIIKPAQVRAYQDDWCISDPEGIFFHEDCDKYYYCDEDGFLNEYWCPEETPIFDYYDLVCMAEGGDAMCWAWIDDGNWDGECPSDPNQVQFLPGENCNEYYICMNGWPSPLNCAPGQHWNQMWGYCDSPVNAQCDVSLLKNISSYEF